MNRLLALLIVATIAGETAFSQSQGGRRIAGPTVRMAQENSVEGASAAVPRPSPRSRRIPARMVADQSILEAAPDQGEVVYEDAPEMVLGESYSADEAIASIGGCSSCGDAGCGSCDTGCGNPLGFDICNPGGFDGSQLCICLPSHGWASVEYMMFYQPGMETPALVTDAVTGGNVLYGGNNDILSGRLDGLRVRFGWWFVNHPNLGIEGEFVGSGENTETFDRTSNGTPVLARPYFNVIAGIPDSSVVANANALNGPIVTNGRVRVDSTSEFTGVAVRFRKLAHCESSSAFSLLHGGQVPTQYRYEGTLGWRYYQLDETLTIQENKNVVGVANLEIQDRFRTFNQFNGVEFGVNWQGRRGFWTLETLMRMGIGNNRQRVTISGLTTTNGVPLPPAQGGVLALQPNIAGSPYVRDQLGVAPELGATLKYQLTQRLEMKVGYSFNYWSNVLRPGEQIDFNVDPNWMPPGAGARPSPGFAFQDTGYYIHGLTLGGEYRW